MVISKKRCFQHWLQFWWFCFFWRARFTGYVKRWHRGRQIADRGHGRTRGSAFGTVGRTGSGAVFTVICRGFVYLRYQGTQVLRRDGSIYDTAGICGTSAVFSRRINGKRRENSGSDIFTSGGEVLLLLLFRDRGRSHHGELFYAERKRKAGRLCSISS